MWSWQSLVLGRPQREIWDRVYFEAPWQQLFDAFNSIPVYTALAMAALWWRWRLGLWIALSALLHIACDLPLHREDAHAHLWPISDWHFVSPVSYWDRAHHGALFSLFELALLAGSAAWLGRRARSTWLRLALGATLLACAASWAALTFWLEG